MDEKLNIELTILMPCLNEEENIAFCIEQAKEYIQKNHLSAEILIVDNNSTDDSADMARDHGATVITEHRRGYGRALRNGLAVAKGDVIIFGDCDSTYDFANLDPLYLPLAENKTDFMTGDRFGGQMEDGAMSWSHKLGVPFLSWCGRVKFGVKIHDWHCGIRGIRKDALKKLNLQTDGMEFATEMIAEASRKGLRIGEVSVPLKRAQNERQEKLQTIRDGFRHLWYIVRA
ncbi:MAG: glycosyltransferase family 2 protein [Eubacterium sp.]|nr:glycosyltransferase family 2 protein [Eubacterium sp.]